MVWYEDMKGLILNIRHRYRGLRDFHHSPDRIQTLVYFLSEVALAWNGSLEALHKSKTIRASVSNNQTVVSFEVYSGSPAPSYLLWKELKILKAPFPTFLQMMTIQSSFGYCDTPHYAGTTIPALIRSLSAPFTNIVWIVLAFLCVFSTLVLKFSYVHDTKFILVSDPGCVFGFTFFNVE